LVNKTLMHASWCQNYGKFCVFKPYKMTQNTKHIERITLPLRDYCSLSQEGRECIRESPTTTYHYFYC